MVRILRDSAKIFGSDTFLDYPIGNVIRARREAENYADAQKRQAVNKGMLRILYHCSKFYMIIGQDRMSSRLIDEARAVYVGEVMDRAYPNSLPALAQAREGNFGRQGTVDIPLCEAMYQSIQPEVADADPADDETIMACVTADPGDITITSRDVALAALNRVSSALLLTRSDLVTRTDDRLGSPTHEIRSMKSLSRLGARAFWLPASWLLLAVALVACGGGGSTLPPAATSPAPATTTPDRDRTLTVYSGRSQTLVHPLLVAFGEQTGIGIRVKYAGSSSTAATLLEEGDNTPADVVFMQDPGSLGILADAAMLSQIPQALLDKVDPRFRSPAGLWIGTSGRARTIIYNTEAIDPETDLPPSILDFTRPEWRGRVGWAPRNGSFQAFVTALRLTLGEDAAREWLIGMRDNDAVDYPNNVTTVSAAAAGEVDVGFVNHYYLERFLEEHGEGFGARNHYLGNGDPGALVLVAGVGILDASENKDIAEEFVDFLLGGPAQTYFAQEIKEYPVSAGVEPAGELPALESLDPPNLDLGSLSDLEGTLDLLRDTEVLP